MEDRGSTGKSDGKAKRPTSISLGIAGSISQSFDRGGRITADARSLSGIAGDAGTGTQSFSYDDLSRLTGSSGLATSRSYQYDLDGNRTRRVEGSVTPPGLSRVKFLGQFRAEIGWAQALRPAPVPVGFVGTRLLEREPSAVWQSRPPAPRLN